MADPQAATLTQLRNIQARAGKTIAELHAVLAASGPPPAAPAADAADDPLDALYTGAKAPLRALHEAVIRQVRGFGEFEQAPKRAYVSLRRKKQFAMVGPATKDLIEIGINVRDLAPGARLKTMPAGGMCPYTLRIAGPGDIDAELTGWLRAAYDAAG